MDRIPWFKLDLEFAFSYSVLLKKFICYPTLEAESTSLIKIINQFDLILWSLFMLHFTTKSIILLHMKHKEVTNYGYSCKNFR